MRKVLRIFGAAALMFAVGGCGGVATTKPGQAVNKKDQKDKDQVAQGDSSEDGWWCNTHGIPEDECSLCSADVEKKCKAAGDWCAKHDRAQSQCFQCDPTLKEKYAARYRDKYQKEPPPVKD